MQRKVTVVRADLGAPVVAVRIDGPTVTVFADHAAPETMIATMTRVAQFYADADAQDRSGRGGAERG